MNTIQQTLLIPSDRRLRLDLTLPDSVPTGMAEVLVVFSPVQELPPVAPSPLARFAGCLADSAAFAADPVEMQRAVRDEW